MSKTPLKRTPLYEEHLKQGALMVDFAGWEMPLHYGSQLEEHRFVRENVGVFDVSHMGIVDITGKNSALFLRQVLANNIDKLTEPGSALYTCMLNESGGVLDDLIVYYISSEHYRCIVNAATTEKDLAWLLKQAKPYASLSIQLIPHFSILAVQGPRSFEMLSAVFPHLSEKIDKLKPFRFLFETNLFIARTGYTGEMGYEILCASHDAPQIWQKLLSVGVHPIGLGARDTLRLEAGYCLYGQDMDETVSPWVSNLMWTVSFDPERDFIGRKALLEQKEKGIEHKLTGLNLLEKGILRQNQIIFVDEKPVGKITSGSFSPTLKRSIALARVNMDIDNGCTVNVRGKFLKAEITKPPFVRSRTR